MSYLKIPSTKACFLICDLHIYFIYESIQPNILVFYLIYCIRCYAICILSVSQSNEMKVSEALLD